MDTNTCPACLLTLNSGGEVTLALPYVGNLKTGAFEPSGDRASTVHVACLGRIGRGDIKWVAVDDSQAAR